MKEPLLAILARLMDVSVKQGTNDRTYKLQFQVDPASQPELISLMGDEAYLIRWQGDMLGNGGTIKMANTKTDAKNETTAMLGVDFPQSEIRWVPDFVTKTGQSGRLQFFAEDLVDLTTRASDESEDELAD